MRASSGQLTKASSGSDVIRLFVMELRERRMCALLRLEDTGPRCKFQGKNHSIYSSHLSRLLHEAQGPRVVENARAHARQLVERCKPWMVIILRKGRKKDHERKAGRQEHVSRNLPGNKWIMLNRTGAGEFEKKNQSREKKQSTKVGP